MSAKHEKPLRIPMNFDDALSLLVQVKPPAVGWKEYEKRLKSEKRKRNRKDKSVA
ncbi:hypothetical protein JQ599_31940 [Bradyrhizobium diazoefficiens]|nr:hypothetical protein [Bradyrhizobium diazoefficiens]MBR0704554.1 hypothetical protein [Bradyrhizobium diazoefficiens]MBR0773122.1 hypothetical protein [Bradyrhizobium diazoefficiens]